MDPDIFSHARLKINKETQNKGLMPHTSVDFHFDRQSLISASVFVSDFACLVLFDVFFVFYFLPEI